MDTYTKGVMTVIAICLVSISFQLSDTKPIENAHSENGHAPIVTKADLAYEMTLSNGNFINSLFTEVEKLKKKSHSH